MAGSSGARGGHKCTVGLNVDLHDACTVAPKMEPNFHSHLLLHDSVTQNTHDFWHQFWGPFAGYLKRRGLNRCVDLSGSVRAGQSAHGSISGASRVARSTDGLTASPKKPTTFWFQFCGQFASYLKRFWLNRCLHSRPMGLASPAAFFVDRLGAPPKKLLSFGTNFEHQSQTIWHALGLLLCFPPPLQSCLLPGFLACLRLCLLACCFARVLYRSWYCKPGGPTYHLGRSLGWACFLGNK